MNTRSDAIGLRIHVAGRVQGVGFRPWACTLARKIGVSGRIWNDAEGVTVEAFGSPDKVKRLRELLTRPTLPAALVSSVQSDVIVWDNCNRFDIIPSEPGGSQRLSIPPDLALCADCRRELTDPRNRRYRYPFINCTQCGPRYTICSDLPYDRTRTTMQCFVQCEACEREYRDATNRRFHAEPNACPTCGPRLRLVTSDGSKIAGDEISNACVRLRAGDILAIKSLGGVHLACDAGNAAAVRRLRARKRRDEKPLAVMAPSIEIAEELACIGAAERALLCSAARPIALLRRRDGNGVASEVAPRNPRLGVMLPYTPLHELLLSEFSGPLVMTSGNMSDDPIVTDDADALARLIGIADAFLLHDRPIANRCDDSVACVIAGEPTLIRRARGYVPSPIEIPGRFARPILACGAHMKNTFCLAYRGQAWLGPHIGDLETDEACQAFEESIERFIRLVGITPEIVAHDLHPDYYSTRYAIARPAAARVSVQHHHAHIASVCAEHGVTGPVIGLAWDGTGFGTDNTAWGGEALWVNGGAFRRVATLRPLPLAGGDTAIRQVWRIALAALDDAYGGEHPLDRLRLFDAIDPRQVALVRQMIAQKTIAPRAHGVGRYFDAVGALLLSRPESHFEGQVAMECSFLVNDSAQRPYEFNVSTGDVSELDLRSMFRALVQDLLNGIAPATIAGRFHATMAAVGQTMISLAQDRFGPIPVALSGGCFQNEHLVAALEGALGSSRRVLRHRLVPPGDGGVALGQALIADLHICGAASS